MTWYNSYTNLPFRHLGNSVETGIDCFNLITHIFKKELDIEIPYLTSDWCNIVDDDWYMKTHEKWIDTASTEEHGWIRVKEPKVYDVITMSLGATHVTNHAALYVDHNKILHTMDNHKSWIAPYGNYYKQYTVGIFRWKDLIN